MHYSVNTQHEVLGLDLYVVDFEDLMTLYDEAFEGKGDLVVTLLDVANAYGSLPHRVIMTALRRADVSDEMCKTR